MTPEAAAAPDALSLLPAVLAIALALVTRQVLISLLGGILAGAMLLSGAALGPAATLDLLVGVIADADHVKIIVFTLGMGGMVGVAAQAGGTRGIVERVAGVARSARSASLATWAMGICIFFDDYASTLLVGNTMRPITDRVRISREKLSYIVDSTAAPIASIAIVSTWIGFEVSQLGDAMKASGIEGSAYEIFLAGIPGRFYPILALAFVGMIAWSRRDFGPMLAAERRARTEGHLIRPGGSPLMDDSLVDEVEDSGDVPPRAWLAVAPVLGLVGTVLAVLQHKGADASYDALLYGSGFGSLVAVVGAVTVRALTVKRALDAYVIGVRAMTMAIMVLVLAWGIGKVMSDLHSGQYVAGLVGEALPAWSLPTVTFLISAVMALATGSSWGTMTILFPIVIPVVAVHGTGPEVHALLMTTASGVLAGSVFGDHCSPISDTTVLSSIASAADHVDHTRTQIPYALLCAAVSVLFGTLPAGFGVPSLVLLALCLAVLWGVLRVVGEVVPDAPLQPEPAAASGDPAPEHGTS